MSLQAVVPAAGRGTRLRPLTDTRPKGLVEVGRKPLLTRCFEVLDAIGVSELIVVVGYKGDQIRSYYGESFNDIPITYTTQKKRRGLADAVATAEQHIDGSFIVMNGDNIVDGDLQTLADEHENRDVASSLLVENVSEEIARTRGVCEFDEDGKLIGFVEKPETPPSTKASAGCFVLNPIVFDAIRVITPSKRGEYELTDAIDLLLYAGHPVRTVVFDGSRVNVNTEEDIQKAERLLLE
jgi:glucose-1-phosphate thymidylyltransferase